MAATASQFTGPTPVKEYDVMVLGWILAHVAGSRTPPYQNSARLHEDWISSTNATVTNAEQNRGGMGWETSNALPRMR
jgi:hypothetical protein